MSSDVAPAVVTFVFTDIEGSTRLWQQDPVAMSVAVARHDALLRETVESRQGRVIKTMGDGIFAVFADALDALNAVTDVQRKLADPGATGGLMLRVRCGVHRGTAESRDSEYFGDHVNRTARLMAVAHGGQVVVSEEVTAAIVDRMPAGAKLEGLGVVRLRDFPEPFPVYQLQAPGLRAKFPPLRTSALSPNNLPTLATSFVGREAQLAELAKLLARDRLVTITGSGGIGKTRLALEVAAGIRDQFEDGVWFIDLSGMADAALVPNAVAKILQVSEEPGMAMLESLQQSLKSRRMLLVLDNCEHLLASCAHLARQLLPAALEVRMLATSRAALGVDDERTYALPPMSAPGPTERMDVLDRFESVRLFRDRAALRQAGFAIDAANAQAVAEICRRLDGIPLAIELAAARVRTFSVAEIARRLDQRFGLLVGGGTAVLPRQQTLRALIEWSYDLLEPSEQVLFARLSVFAGGWTLDAAEDIGAFGSEQADVQSTLTGLIQKSLVLIGHGGERYRYLETIREYARERLEESSEVSAIPARHGEFYLSLTEQAETAIIGGTQQALWLERLELEIDNLRVALERAVSSSGDADRALRMCGALYRFWMQRGHMREGGKWCERATTMATGSSGPALAKALLSFGSLVYRMGDLNKAHGLLQRALAASRAIGEPNLQARILNNLAIIAQERGNSAGARDFYERAATAARDGSSRALEALILGNLGNLTVIHGDVAVGKPILERALSLCRELDDQAMMANVLGYLGNAASYAGDYALALAYNTESLAIARTLDAKGTIAQETSVRGEIMVFLSDIPAAQAHYRDALQQLAELDLPYVAACVLDSVPNLAIALHQYSRAAELLGAADAVWTAIASQRSAMEATRYESLRAACLKVLGDTAFGEAWTIGNRMSTDAAINAARTWLAGYPETRADQGDGGSAD